MSDHIELTEEQRASLVIAICGPNGDHREGEIVIADKALDRMTPKQMQFAKLLLLRVLVALAEFELTREDDSISARQREEGEG